MPNYSYKCQGCNVIQNATHAITEDPNLTCDQCAVSLVRIPSVLAVTFNAKDFYSTSP